MQKETSNFKEDSFSQRILGIIGRQGYEFREYSYPENLGDDSLNQGHSILFNINVTKGTKIDNSSTKVIDNKNTISPVSKRPVSDSRRGDERSRISRQNGTRRIESAILLYMPDNITTSYSTNWDVGETQVAEGLLRTWDLGKAGVNAFADIWQQTDGLMDAAGGMASRAGAFVYSQLNETNALDFIQSNTSSTDVSNAISLFRREFRNPYMDFMFRGVSPRTFTMNFRFMPSSPTETERVKNIIHQFKYHSMPEITRDPIFGVFYKYPSEFDITFLTSSGENKYLHKFGTCACTNVSVDYTAAGMWSAFRENEHGAAPTAISMSLSFTELEFLDRNRIEEGF